MKAWDIINGNSIDNMPYEEKRELYDQLRLFFLTEDIQGYVNSSTFTKYNAKEVAEYAMENWDHELGYWANIKNSLITLGYLK